MMPAADSVQVVTFCKTRQGDSRKLNKIR